MFCEIRCVSNCVSLRCILWCVFRRQDSHVKCVQPGLPATVQHSIETVVCTPGCWRGSYIRIQCSPDWRGGPWHKYGHLAICRFVYVEYIVHGSKNQNVSKLLPKRMSDISTCFCKSCSQKCGTFSSFPWLSPDIYHIIILRNPNRHTFESIVIARRLFH